ncbi:MAG: SgcJ/EcaC family oxidoreductase [Candidatus Latescibacteria bacterium]|nr:SgcJ/EcaC family oxidoreductase [bacterium]MBD3423212.1 SgcJ/EcaC family oxidoreductase [Candidatus Latescibacterota bacterium]
MTDKESISRLFDLWNLAVISGDPDRVLECYADNAVLLPTLSARVRHNHREIRDYFEHFLAGEPEGKVIEKNIRIFGDIAVNSGLYDFHMHRSGKTVSARFTFVYRNYPKGWLIVEHHSSPLPG